MNIIAAFVVGLIFGACVGIVVAALLVAARSANREERSNA